MKLFSDSSMSVVDLDQNNIPSCLVILKNIPDKEGVLLTHS